MLLRNAGFVPVWLEVPRIPKKNKLPARFHSAKATTSQKIAALQRFYAALHFS
jgi:hypothetical protein